MKKVKVILIMLLFVAGLVAILGSGGGGSDSGSSSSPSPSPSPPSECGSAPSVTHFYTDTPNYGDLTIEVYNPGRNIDYIDWEIDGPSSSCSGSGRGFADGTTNSTDYPYYKVGGKLKCSGSYRFAASLHYGGHCTTQIYYSNTTLSSINTYDITSDDSEIIDEWSVEEIGEETKVLFPKIE